MSWLKICEQYDDTRKKMVDSVKLSIYRSVIIKFLTISFLILLSGFSYAFYTYEENDFTSSDELKIDTITDNVENLLSETNTVARKN